MLALISFEKPAAGVPKVNAAVSHQAQREPPIRQQKRADEIHVAGNLLIHVQWWTPRPGHGQRANTKAAFARLAADRQI